MSTEQPTPETDEHEHFVASFSPKYCDPEFCRTLERQRDTARAEAKEEKDQCERMTIERNEWQCSAMLYHSELRDLAEGKKVETNLGYAVEKLIRGLRAEVDRLTKERDDAPSPAETVQKDWDAMNGFTDEAKARAMFNLALSLEGDLNAMIRDADAYKEQLSKCEAHAGAMAKEYDAQVDSLRALVIAKREEN